MGFRVLALCFLCYAAVRGLQESYAVFLLPLSAEFGWSRGQVSSVYSFGFIVIGFAGPLIGILSDRWGPLRVSLAGIVLAAAAAALASQADALWQLYLTVGIMMGVAASCTGFVTITALLSRWFRERLNTALAIAHSSSGVGILLFGPTAQLLIDSGGWRFAYLVLAAGLAALLPVFLVLRWRVAEAGHPDLRGPLTRPRHGNARQPAGDALDLAAALRTAAFWGMAFSFLCTSGAMFLVVLQTPAFLVETGYTPREAADAFGLLGLLLPAGMVGFGWLGDRIGRPQAVLISYALTISGIFCLSLLAAGPSTVLLALFIAMFGGTFGCRGPAMSTIAALVFRGPHFGRIYGCITLGMGLGGGTGAWLGGALYDFTGGYQSGLVIAMVLLALGAVPFVAVRAIRRG